MSNTPFEYAGSLRIGTVDFVSPDEVKVVLDIDAPDSIALNAGGARPFPRVNSYVLIPVDEGFIVGQIEWLTVERSTFPKRRGMKDFGLIDLPYPLRRMSLNPIGNLRKKVNEKEKYVFKRGANSLPSIGTGVMLPTIEQLRAIVESGERRRVKIGTSPMAGNAEVFVDPDRLFGRHLAVLGNTGSGKSCSVAGLIRWSLKEASKVSDKSPNARFIILDPNGEYWKAFSDKKGPSQARIFKVESGGQQSGESLKIPLWFWNSAEWCSLTQASSRTQRPTLIQALRAVRDGQTEVIEAPSLEMRRYLRTLVTTLRMEKNSGRPWGSFPGPKNFYEKIEKWRESLHPELSNFENQEGEALTFFVENLERLCAPRRVRFPTFDFTRQEIENLLSQANNAFFAFGGQETETFPKDVDAPIPFSSQSFIRSVEATAEMLNVSEYAETLLIRIKSMLSNSRMKRIIDDSEESSLEEWLSSYIGGSDNDDCKVTIIDLSLVPTEIIHTLIAVVARIIFESLQRYRRSYGLALPTVLVMEEAHTFVKRYAEGQEDQDPAATCCKVFERIAREGRKFGLGLVLSSQRPSELSPTVLSQCNSFLLHRISNDRDQTLVQKLVPDNLKGLLRELPSLPSQNAILLGWASELPILLRMNDLPYENQPQSSDPDFWDVWTRRNQQDEEVIREANWKEIADEWQGIVNEDQENQEDQEDQEDQENHLDENMPF
ncbi:MAG: ATP-binding protein [Calditrichaeota bacterium]|nr:ATP-binding protein [Calditrichota bacterium]HQU71403.1 ATP-binding protein [Calditrichia bacterium]